MRSMRIAAAVSLALTALAASIGVSGQGASLARLLVVLKDGRALAIIDPATMKETGRVPLGENVHEVTVSDDGRLAFVSGGVPEGTDAGRRRYIYIVDLEARKLVRAVDIGVLSNPHGVEFAGGKVYFTAENYKAIGRLDPPTGRIDWWLGVGQDRGHMLAVSPDRTKIFTANTNSNSVAVVEGLNPPGWTVSAIPIGRGPEGIAITPDGREVWAPHTEDPNVSVIDVAARKVSRTVNAGTRRGIRVKFTPDGQRALITDAVSGELVVIDAPGGTVIKKVQIGTPGECEKTKPGPTCTSGVLVSPDGARAFVAAEFDNNVAVVDLKTLVVASRIPLGAGSHPDGMAWVGAR